MKVFLKNGASFLIFGFIPLIILTLGYFYYDPFKVLKVYSDYSFPHVVSNKDYISTEMFLKNNPKQQYNSFIFGSSRTVAFTPSSWSHFLPKGAKPFVFDAAKESIYGIYTKLKFMESSNIKIDNALLLFCRDVSFDNDHNSEGHLFIKHPKTSGESPTAFQFEFYKAYLNPKFLFCFYDYTFTKNYKSYMKGYIEYRKISLNALTNETHIIDQEQEITQNPEAYYTTRARVFYERTGEKTDSIQRINKKERFMLREIKRILEQNKTNYKVILSPLYEQIKFNPTDFQELHTLFNGRLYDFSGQNTFTNSKTNYYESSHYRPKIGDQILKIIYP